MHIDIYNSLSPADWNENLQKIQLISCKKISYVIKLFINIEIRMDKLYQVPSFEIEFSTIDESPLETVSNFEKLQKILCILQKQWFFSVL